MKTSWDFVLSTIRPKGEPGFDLEGRRAKSQSTFLEARGIYIRKTVQVGQERITEGRDYPVTHDEFIALVNGGGEIVRANERGTNGGGVFLNAGVLLHTVRFGLANFTLASSQTITWPT